LNLFSAINEGLKTVHKNYQLLFIHFAFLFIAFFGVFFFLGIPLGIFFVIFGVDLTDILKGSFIEIVISSINLFKKFLIFAIFFLLSLLIYIFFVAGLWVYIFSGTLGIIYQYLSKGLTFNFKEFHQYGKKFFWKVGFYSIFSTLLLIMFTFIYSLISNINNSFIEFLRQYSHSVSVFFSVFMYLTILLAALVTFIVLISFILFGYYGIVGRNLKILETIKESKELILKNPNCIIKAFLLFIIYILTGGFILFLGFPLAIIPKVGTILAALYQFITQFAHIYITMVLFSTFFAYYLHIREIFQGAIEGSDTSQ